MTIIERALVHKKRSRRTNMTETILLRIVREQDRRQEIRHVNAGFLREIRVREPEILYACTTDRPISIALAAVVGGHCEFPVPVISVCQELEITGRSTRSFIKAIAFVNVGIAA